MGFLKHEGDARPVGVERPAELPEANLALSDSARVTT